MMNFFEKFFSKKGNSESVVLIDIGASSVAGAYARYEEKQSPVLVYTKRLPIETHSDEAHDIAMLRALNLVGKDLIKNGAPALARHTGSGSADSILVSVDSPWQETHVRMEDFEPVRGEPFLFTKSLVAKKIEETRAIPPGKILADESIISTGLNGYETNSPYGERAHRATITILTSLIERHVAKSILSTLSGLYHTKNIQSVSGDSLRYQALRTIFPHERDVITLDATGESLTAISLMRKGVFVTMENVYTSSTDKEWMHSVIQKLHEIATLYPLPRTIFLLAREEDTQPLRQSLDKADFSQLWLSENSPKIVSLMKSQMGGAVRHLSTASADLILILMAVYYPLSKRDAEETL